MNYIETNKKLWNAKTEHHYTSEFYNLEEFISGKNSLNAIELNLLGDIKGKRILHLQCHFGQDSISLSRLGAEVTAVDFSDKAIEKANELNKKLNTRVEFICCNVYDLEKHLDKNFDIVFTSYGTIGWLNDLEAWAKIIAHYLRPNGKFIFVEFHPVVWMFDYDFTKVQYNYFIDEPIIETESGTYANKEANINLQSVGWNHALSEVFGVLQNNNLHVIVFEEYNYSPYNCFHGMIEIEKSKFQIEKLGNKIPLVYSLVAEKESMEFYTH